MVAAIIYVVGVKGHVQLIGIGKRPHLWQAPGDRVCSNGGGNMIWKGADVNGWLRGLQKQKGGVHLFGT